MSEAAKLAVVKRLCRMLVRVVLGKQKVAEYDAMIRRWDAMTPPELVAENQRLRDRLRKTLDSSPGAP